MTTKTKHLSWILPLVVVLFALGCFALSTQAAVQEVILKGTEDPKLNLCSFLQLIVNIKNLVFMVGAPITALMIIAGGVLLAASAGVGPQVERAKKIITSGIIGLVIVVCAWLIVGGIITALFGRDVGPAWWTIEGCSVTDTDNPSDPNNPSNPNNPNNPNPPSNDPNTATTEGACRAACLPKRYNWDGANQRCSCSSQGSLTIDPNAVDGRLGDGGQEFLTCLESFFMPPDAATVWRVGDPNSECYDTDRWTDDACIFEKYSCHYGGRNCRGESFSIDFTDVSDKGVFMAAVISCGGAPPSDKGSYIHVRFTSGCMCSDEI